MRTFRIVGLAMILYGGVMLALLFTPAREWALEHSIASVVSRTDRRVGNTVSGPVDEPMAIAGSAVLLFAGLWFALLVPFVMSRNKAKMMRSVDEGAAQGD